MSGITSCIIDVSTRTNTMRKEYFERIVEVEQSFRTFQIILITGLLSLNSLFYCFVKSLKGKWANILRLVDLETKDKLQLFILVHFSNKHLLHLTKAVQDMT